MLGAIIGDVVGSRFEFNNHRSKDFELITEKSTYTDDTVLTVAIMDWLMHAKVYDSYTMTEYLQKWGRKYPNAGYGNRFSSWLWSNDPKPYGSKGNGGGMRVSPVAYFAQTYREALHLSDLVTSVTHNHREGMKGARLIAYATYMALRGDTKESIQRMAESFYEGFEKLNYKDLVKNNKFSELAEDACPQAVYCFLISKDFEDCLRISVSIGGDTDTICAMSCSIAKAYYRYVPKELLNKVREKLEPEMLEVIDKFDDVFVGNR